MLFFLRDIVKSRSREDNFRLCIRRLCVSSGECIAITGQSGCGKSTALDLLGMTLKPDQAGTFTFSPAGDIQDICTIWEDHKLDCMSALRRQYVGYVLQTGELLPFFSVRENVLLTAQLAGMPDNEAQEHVASLMERLQIDALARAMPASLSVGERQRAAICRALAAKPRVILADEPTAALDPVLARKVMRLFLDVVRETHAALVMVSHDIGLVKEFAFREVPCVVQRTENGVETVLDDGSALGRTDV